MAKDKPGVSINEILWHPSKSDTRVPIRFADNLPLLKGSPTPSTLPTLVFPGYGVGAGGRKRLLYHLAEQDKHAVVVDLPLTHPALRGDGDLVIQLAREGPHLVGNALRERYRLDEPIPALGQSKGAAIVGRAIEEDHTGIGDVALVQPPELHRATPLEVPDREERRLVRKLVRSLALNSSGQERNWGTMRAEGISLVTFIQDTAIGQFRIIAGPVVTGSLVSPVLAHVESGNTVLVMSSHRDSVFPGGQIFSTLDAAAQAATKSGAQVREGGRLLVYLDEGVPHLSIDNTKGRALVNTALDRLKNPKGSNGAILLYPTIRTRLVK